MTVSLHKSNYPSRTAHFFFLLNRSFIAVWCNNLWKCKWKDVAGPAPGFEANSLMQSVTVNDCHPCRVHPMPCSQGDFTGMQRRTALARPHWPLVARQLPQRRGAVCFGSFRSHKWNRDPNQLESAWWEKNPYTGSLQPIKLYLKPIRHLFTVMAGRALFDMKTCLKAHKRWLIAVWNSCNNHENPRI